MEEKLREQLSRPFSRVLGIGQAAKILKIHKGMLICIGDKSAHNLISRNIIPHICIYDGICKRKPVSEKIINEIEKEYAGEISLVKNPASEITLELEEKIIELVKKGRGAIKVIGEDDLAALVSFANASLGSIVAYGQPNEGIVLVEITPRQKDRAKDLIKRVREKN